MLFEQQNQARTCVIQNPKKCKKSFKMAILPRYSTIVFSFFFFHNKV